MMPRRVQRRRVKGFRLADAARGRKVVCVSRPSRFGNPYRVGAPLALAGGAALVIDRATALRLYEGWLRARLAADPGFLDELRGCDLACFCPLADAAGRPVECHADLLLAYANAAPAPASND